MDNFFHSCPPKMEDQGRHLGDFKTATRRNEYIKYINDIHRDDQYRLFLQSNGTELLDNMWKYQKKYNKCFVNDCIHHYPTRTNPRQFVQEREAYDSIFNLKTNKPLAPMRQCNKYEDYRLNPADPPIDERPMFAHAGTGPADVEQEVYPDSQCRSCGDGYLIDPKQ
jgi:hypothetical protein